MGHNRKTLNETSTYYQKLKEFHEALLCTERFRGEVTFPKETWDEESGCLNDKLTFCLRVRRALFMNIITRWKSMSSARYFPSRKNRAGRKLKKRKKSRKIYSRRNLWIKEIVQSHYLYVS